MEEITEMEKFGHFAEISVVVQRCIYNIHICMRIIQGDFFNWYPPSVRLQSKSHQKVLSVRIYLPADIYDI